MAFRQKDEERVRKFPFLACHHFHAEFKYLYWYLF